MNVLCVAEKPSIARSISQILSGGQFETRPTGNQYIRNFVFDYPQTRARFTVTAVSGHLLSHDFDAAHAKWNSCDPFDLFEAPVYAEVAKDKKTIECNLINEAKRAQMLMIWTDCDREGENIGAEIASICRRANRNIVVKRARFSAIIAQQIHNAAQHPGELDMAQAYAVDARTELDLRIGAAFTRFQTLTLQARLQGDLEGLVSYGPCQFPTLGFVVARYNQVKAFVPETFYYIHLSLLSPPAEISDEQTETVFTWKRGHLFEADVVFALYEGVMEDPQVVVRKVNKKQAKKWKPLPLTTVELQKAGSRLLKLAPKAVLDIAEKLYQGGFLSYPRTETDQFDPQFDFMSLIQKQTADGAWGNFAASLQQGGFSSPRKGKNNDKAHPPIHPTAHAGNLAGNEKKVYEFITRRFLACCSKDAVGFETTVEVTCGGEEFSATGLIVLERNYLEVYPYDKWNSKQIPDFVEGQQLMPSVCEMKEGETTSPSLLTEADLVTLMDKNGIGTDATIAQHIDTIVKREYVIERHEGQTKYLVPSTLGIGLIEGYNEIGFERSLSKPQLRRETERSMVQVCEGTKTKNDMLVESIDQYKDMFIKAKREFDKVVQSVRTRLHGNGNGADVQGAGRGGGRGGGGGGGDADGPGGRGGRGRGAPRGRDNSSAPRSSRGGHGGGPGPGRGAGTSHNADSNNNGYAPPPAPHSRPRPPSSDQECHCGASAVERASTRAPNNGRRYWTCGVDEQDGCGFFEWIDGPSSQPAPNAPLPPPPPKAIPTKRSPPVQSDLAARSSELPKRCLCDLTAVLRTVTKEGATLGKQFWTCPNSKKAQCSFFEWAEQDGATSTPLSRSQSSGQPSDTCYKCGQTGHWASACTNNQPQKSSSFGSRTNTNVTGTCFKCGEEGHFSNACPQAVGGSKTKAGPAPVGECFKCGEPGHYSNACPNGERPNKRPAVGTRGAKRGRGSRGGSSRGAGKGASKRGRKKSNFNAADEF
ncbi:prokaryotic type I DNA topoisomerase [Heliocybe sulcata]|uniref:DNA topoisomerase n=1 Tax=Heliocybe sulcata TaxID=5364 RepID=A0A5C3NBC1_9AGAM|nr:prokaryotic type I DNA topoisomerase [Heliocybe sulcata]